MENSRIVSIGPDEEFPNQFPEGELDKLDWMVIWYESGSYEGSGDAYAKTKDGKYWYINLGHCSCFGPWDHSEKSWEELDIGQLRIHIGINKSVEERSNMELKLIESITSLNC